MSAAEFNSIHWIALVRGGKLEWNSVTGLEKRNVEIYFLPAVWQN